jgi:cytochrome c oxidase subunit IV
MSHTVIKTRLYWFVWIALVCLTWITAIVSRIELGFWNTPVALVIAACKASLVVLFFMGLRYENYKMVWIVAVAGIFWLVLLLALSMLDYGTRGYLNVPGK